MKRVLKYGWGFFMVLAAAFLAVFVYSRYFEKPQVVTVKETPAVRYTGFPGRKLDCLTSPSPPRILSMRWYTL